MLDKARHRRRGFLTLAGATLLVIVIGFAMSKPGPDAALRALSEDGYATTQEEWQALYLEPTEGDNAADLYLAAMAAFDEEAMLSNDALLEILSSTFTELAPDGRLSIGHRIALEGYLDSQQEALQLAHRAAAIEDCWFPIDVCSPVRVSPLCRELRYLVRGLRHEAFYCFDNRDAAGAQRAVITSFDAARSLNPMPNFLTFLTSISFHGTAAGVLQEHLSLSTLTDPQLVALSSAVDCGFDERKLRNALNGGMIEILSEVDSMAKTSIGGRVAQSTGLAKMDASRFVEDMRALLESTKGPTESLLSRIGSIDSLDYRGRDVGMTTRATYFLQGEFKSASAHPPTLQRVCQSYLRSIAFTRLAQVGIAVARHRLKHGAPPETLEALVPDFLPELPVGPHHGRPLVYVVRDHGFTVYALGVNGVDDGGVARSDDKRFDGMLDVPFTVTWPEQAALSP
jgi:hypothetical protein